MQYDPHTRRKLLTYVGTDVVTGHNYDDFGRESRKVVVTHGVQLITDFEYDLLGRTKKVSYPDYTVMNYDYEGAYLKSVCAMDGTCDENTTWVSDIEYDELGREASIVDKHGTRGFEYDATTYQLKRKTFQESTSGELWLDLNYGYDVMGRIDGVTDDHNGPGQDGISASASFTYDDHSRLESWAWNGSTRWFKYDELENLTGRSLASATDPANQVYDDPARPHAIKSRTDTGKSYEYDADGNMTRRGGQYLTYDSANQLVCVGTAQGLCDVASFGYDAEGTRAYEIAEGTTRVFVEDLFVWNASNNKAITRVYANGREIGQQNRFNATLVTGWLPPGWDVPVEPGEVLGAALAATALLLALMASRSGSVGMIRRSPGAASAAILTSVAVLLPPPAWAGGGGGEITRNFSYQDHLGTRVLQVSDTPDLIYRRVFEPFGEVVAESVGTEEYRGYLTGKRESEATRDGLGAGLIDFGARWYDPEIGRFLGIDPIVQAPAIPASHNPYSYVWNDPANLIDPDGTFVFAALAGVIAGALGLGEASLAGGLIILGGSILDAAVAIGFTLVVTNPALVSGTSSSLQGYQAGSAAGAEEGGASSELIDETAVLAAQNAGEIADNPRSESQRTRYPGKPAPSDSQERWDSYWAWYFQTEQYLETLVRDAELEVESATKALESLEAEAALIRENPMVYDPGLDESITIGQTLVKNGRRMSSIDRDLDRARSELGFRKKTLELRREDLAGFRRRFGFIGR